MCNNILTDKNKEAEGGTAKRLAHYIIENPSAFNPVYFFGEESQTYEVGETIAFGLEAKGFNVHCITAEAFTKQYIDYIRYDTRGNIKYFDETFCCADVFMIYNINELVNPVRLESSVPWRLFEIISAYIDQGKQVVLFGRIPPYEYAGCYERYTSRMFSGVTCEVN